MPSEAPPEPRTLLIALDAVPFRVVTEARRRGAFSHWAPPSAVVSPFPTITHVAFSSLFLPLGVPPSLGYELRHFDTDANTTVGGGVMRYARDVPPWFELFDLPLRSITAEMTNYVSPERAARTAIEDIEREVLKSSRDTFLAYVGATDGLMHLYGDEHMVELLLELDGMLDHLRRGHEASRGRPLRIVLFSDHGCGHAKIRHVEGIDHLLEGTGLRVVEHLAEPDDVVAPRFGLVNYGALFLRDPGRAEIAASAIAQHEAVDLVAYAPRPDLVEVVARSGHARVRWRDDGRGRRYGYEDRRGDPLRLADARRRLAAAALVDDDGFAADDDWLRETAFSDFPDPLHRLAEALTGDRIRNRADVLYSFGPAWAGGLHSAVLGAWVRGGRLEGTHGGLDRESSLGFLVASDPLLARAPVLRAEAALAPFADAARGRTGPRG